MSAAQKTKTAGQALRHYFSIGTRTRRWRDDRDLHAAMLEAIGLASAYPGYFCKDTENALRSAFGAYVSIEKHINGYRVAGETVTAVRSLSPYKFAALIDRMVADGVQCTGDGEHWFRENGRTIG